jgi:hypothetical protein
LAKANGIRSVSEIKKLPEIAKFSSGACSGCPALPAIDNFGKQKSRNKSFVSIGYWRRSVCLQGCGIRDWTAANLAAFSSASVWLAAVDSRRLQSQNESVLVVPCAIGDGIFSGFRMKEHDA